jgi:putative CocE/NonD family hydrolase
MSSASHRFIFDARIPMRDGVELSADVYLPHDGNVQPAIVTRTPYDNADPGLVKTAEYFAAHGYAFVSCDVRGRGDSDGRFRPFRGERADGYDTVEWVAEQAWCNGKVAMMGASYACSTQWWAACESPPHLVTIASTAVSGRLIQSPQLRGKLHLQFLLWLQRVGGRTMQPGVPAGDGGPSIDWPAVLTHVPLRDADLALGRCNSAWEEWMAGRKDRQSWHSDSHFHDFAEVRLPVLHVTGWYDGSLTGELEMYEGMLRQSAAADEQYLLIGPWNHAGTRTPRAALGHLEFGDAAVLDMDELHLAWFDRWLKGRKAAWTKERRVRVFCMGENRWHDLAGWPPTTTLTAWYFSSSGKANGGDGDGYLSCAEPTGEPLDQYTYDPRDPTPSAPSLEAFVTGAGPLDHLDRAFVESRSDVLVYTSSALTEPLTIVGTPRVRLWASTSAIDTDFAAALCTVNTEGRSTIVAEGLIRTSYRTGDGPSQPLPAQSVSLYEICLNPTSITVPEGHRLRVDITSAEFPAYDRNPNTGALVGDDEIMSAAVQRIWHSERQSSHIELPVLARWP